MGFSFLTESLPFCSFSLQKCPFLGQNLICINFSFQKFSFLGQNLICLNFLLQKFSFFWQNLICLNFSLHKFSFLAQNLICLNFSLQKFSFLEQNLICSLMYCTTEIHKRLFGLGNYHWNHQIPFLVPQINADYEYVCEFCAVYTRKYSTCSLEGDIQ